MSRNTPLLLALTASIALLAGCYSSGVERNWGRSQRVNFTAQTKHPEAPKTLEEPTGLDPISAAQAMSTHRQQTAKKGKTQQPPSLTDILTGIGED